jgi:anti-sigma factor RsiW
MHAPAMTCRDASNLLPLFFDGELDANQMRAVALHSTRCDRCEDELRRMERVQEAISTHMNAAVDEFDFGALWRGIDQQLATVRVSWWTRARAWWTEGEHGWVVKLPAFAAAAAVAVLGFLLWTRTSASPPQPDAAVVATLDNAASIDSLDSDVDAVTVVNDPETRTTVLWVSDDAAGGGGAP